MEDRVTKILERHRKLVAEKQPWISSWQRIGEFVNTRKQDFQSNHSPGEFLTGNIFDSTAPNANHEMGSSLVGALWPNGGRSFQIGPPRDMDPEIAGSKQVQDWYKKADQIMTDAIDHPKAGFLTSLEEYFWDQGSIGTSGILVEDNDDASYRNEPDLRFSVLDVQSCCISEGYDGFVDTVYKECEYTLKQLVQRYKIENISKDNREKYEKGDVTTKVKVLHAIEPRVDAEKFGYGNAGFDVASIHVEMDTKHILKESGYTSMPAFMTRFWKIVNEVYGRSPAFEAMSDIIEINVLRESIMLATEKLLDPPLVLLEDGVLGGSNVDTSAGGFIIRKVSGRMGEANAKAIEPLMTVGELKDAMNRVIELRTNIQENYFIDRLTDLNNDTRMTLGEANLRNSLREQSLTTVFARQIAELFQRVIERVFEILLLKGKLGLIPGSPEAQEAEEFGAPFLIPEVIAKLMAEGKDAYRVTFISPAARALRAEELRGIQQLVAFISSLGQTMPTAYDLLDIDETIRAYADLTGAPANILRTPEEVTKLRNDRAKQQEAASQAAMREQQANTVKTLGQGAESVSKAGLPVNQFAQQLLQGAA